MRPRHGSTRRMSHRRTLRLTPTVKIAALAVVALGIIAVVVFVFIKPFSGKDSEDVTADVSATPTPTVAPLAQPDMSAGVSELLMKHNSINDPYMSGNEVVFTTDPESSAMLSKVAVYDIEADQTTLIEKIEKKNFSLFEPKINDDFIVYLDCKSEYGGAVCGYDREKDEMFVMREYMFGKPQVSLVGNYALWLQQTGKNSDKLYLFDLTNRENTVIEVFTNPMVYISAADMCEEALVFVQPYRQTEVVGYGTSSSTENEMCIISLTESGDNARKVYYPGMFIYEPKIDGDYLVFLDGTGDEDSRLMLCHKEGETYSVPEEIAVGVLNYDVGDGYVVYTLDDVVYIYYFEDGSTGRLSAETTRARLASANGKGVVWYDVTGGLDTETDVIMSIVVP